MENYWINLYFMCTFPILPLSFTNVGNLCMLDAVSLCLSNLSNVYINIMTSWKLVYGCQTSFSFFWFSFQVYGKYVSIYIGLHDFIVVHLVEMVDFQHLPTACTCVNYIWTWVYGKQPEMWEFPSHFAEGKLYQLSDNYDPQLAWSGKVQVRKQYLFNPYPSFIYKSMLN